MTTPARPCLLAIKATDERVDPGCAVEDRKDVVAAMHGCKPRLVARLHVVAVHRTDALRDGCQGKSVSCEVDIIDRGNDEPARPGSDAEVVPKDHVARD